MTDALKNKQDVLNRLKKILKREIKLRKLPIEIVYIHGSYAKGREHKGSDIDIAVLFNEREYAKTPMKCFTGLNEVCAVLEKEIGRDVDISILNRASLIFCYKIITEGIPLYNSSKKAMYFSQNKIMGMFFDFKPFIDACLTQYARI